LRHRVDCVTLGVLIGHLALCDRFADIVAHGCSRYLRGDG
jgi:hypothetical protein